MFGAQAWCRRSTKGKGNFRELAGSREESEGITVSCDRDGHDTRLHGGLRSLIHSDEMCALCDSLLAPASRPPAAAHPLPAAAARPPPACAVAPEHAQNSGRWSR